MHARYTTDIAMHHCFILLPICAQTAVKHSADRVHIGPCTQASFLLTVRRKTSVNGSYAMLAVNAYDLQHDEFNNVVIVFSFPHIAAGDIDGKNVFYDQSTDDLTCPSAICMAYHQGTLQLVVLLLL